MSTPFIGEIRMVGFSFPPAGWAFCSGQSLSIAQNDALFALIGTTYGGDGQLTFNLPDLRGRIPVHFGTLAGGSTFDIGERAGTETVTLLQNQMPSHIHVILANTGSGTAATPAGNIVAGTSSNVFAQGATQDVALAASSIGLTGGSQPHDNMMPYQCISYIIALEGIFPSRN